MASKATGKQTATRYKTDWEFDPQTGEALVEYWHGPKAAVISKAAAFKAAGFRVTRTNNGAKYECKVYIAQAAGIATGSGSEVPVDRWRISSEWLQLDLRENPKLI